MRLYERTKSSATAPPWLPLVTIRVGARTVPSPVVWIADAKFTGTPHFETKPMMLLGLRQFRDRVLFMSHSTGTVCTGP